ncbi:hypothetical protein NDU88_005703 [Pleurodeles waltl]|uniref:Uncharacterized protein n=1 Tax=Pleurodeles waltl TaxID=8319 RepID=A0AAV7LUT9_PLEWA|nr:hypothetical protein NDU88_005703 [Pleurodeles waltl]
MGVRQRAGMGFVGTVRARALWRRLEVEDFVLFLLLTPASALGAFFLPIVPQSSTRVRNTDKLSLNSRRMVYYADEEKYYQENPDTHEEFGMEERLVEALSTHEGLSKPGSDKGLEAFYPPNSQMEVRICEFQGFILIFCTLESCGLHFRMLQFSVRVVDDTMLDLVYRKERGRTL